MEKIDLLILVLTAIFASLVVLIFVLLKRPEAAAARKGAG